MLKAAKIFVAGHKGLVGSAICRHLEKLGYDNLLLKTRQEVDLTNQQDTMRFFNSEQPEYVFLCAAKVGGIHANNHLPAGFIRDNLFIPKLDVIDAAKEIGVKRLLFLGSSCIYPHNYSQAIKEEFLLTGKLEPTNRPYAVAKIAGIELAWSYNRQYNTRYLAVMPTNLYGYNDNYDLNLSHVIPGLIHKFHRAILQRESFITAWGTGTPRREFLFSDDLAAACIYLMNLSNEKFDPLLNKDIPPIINIGWGKDISILELANLIKKVTNYSGNVHWDHSKPDGTPRKLLDISKISALGWKPKINLQEGLTLAYENFKMSH